MPAGEASPDILAQQWKARVKQEKKQNIAKTPHRKVAKTSNQGPPADPIQRQVKQLAKRELQKILSNQNWNREDRKGKAFKRAQSKWKRRAQRRAEYLQTRYAPNQPLPKPKARKGKLQEQSLRKPAVQSTAMHDVQKIKRCVKVANLDGWVGKGELFDFFGKNCGVVEHIHMSRPEGDSRSAYVTFLSELSASKALAFNKQKLGPDMQRVASISFAESDSQPPTSRSGGEVDSIKSAVLGTLSAPPDCHDDPQEAMLESLLEQKKQQKRLRKRGLPVDAAAAPKDPTHIEPLVKRSRVMLQPRDTATTLAPPKYLKTLNSGTFRLLNDMFCQSTSEDARKFFECSPEMFAKYHEGYRDQASKWPLNPLDIVIEDLKKYKRGFPSIKENKKDEVSPEEPDAPEGEEADPSAGEGGIPRHWRICDLGCGDARLALEMPNHTVFSFDLKAPNERVTVADIAHVPLDSYSCEVAVLCLALLSTNYVDFLTEAHRVLVHKGVLKVVEICSRIPIPELFQQLMRSLGFWCLRMEKINGFFWIFDFCKDGEPVKDWRRQVQKMDPLEVVKPFKYKKR